MFNSSLLYAVECEQLVRDGYSVYSCRELLILTSIEMCRNVFPTVLYNFRTFHCSRVHSIHPPKSNNYPKLCSKIANSRLFLATCQVQSNVVCSKDWKCMQAQRFITIQLCSFLIFLARPKALYTVNFLVYLCNLTNNFMM